MCQRGACPTKLHIAVQGSVELAVEAHFDFAQPGFSFALLMPKTDLSPVRSGHFAYEQVVDGGFGFEGTVKGIDEGVEADAGFTFEDYGFREYRPVCFRIFSCFARDRIWGSGYTSARGIRLLFSTA